MKKLAINIFSGILIFIAITCCTQNTAGPIFKDTSTIAGKVTLNGKFFENFSIVLSKNVNNTSEPYWYQVYNNSSGTFSLNAKTDGVYQVGIILLPHTSFDSVQNNVELKKGQITEVNFNL